MKLADDPRLAKDHFRIRSRELENPDLADSSLGSGTLITT
jgi:hypothetical protein